MPTSQFENPLEPHLSFLPLLGINIKVNERTNMATVKVSSFYLYRHASAISFWFVRTQTTRQLETMPNISLPQYFLRNYTRVLATAIKQ